MNIRVNYRPSFKNIRTKLTFGSADKKDFVSLSPSSIKGKESEEWLGGPIETNVNVDQFLEGLNQMKIIYEYYNKE